MYNAIFPISSDSLIMSTLLSEIEYNSLGNKEYSSKLFWMAVTVSTNADKVRGTVSPMVESSNKVLVGSVDDFLENIPV